MPQLSRRTETFTDSVIRRMTRVSLKYGAVNLSQGFPDFEPPKEILDRLAEVSREDFHQYSITWGAQMIRIHIERALSIFNPSSEELVEGFYSVKLIVVAIYVVLFYKTFYKE